MRALPAPTTIEVCETFDDLTGAFRVIAFQTSGFGGYNAWHWVWDRADSDRWYAALDAGRVTSAQQRRQDGVVLLGKAVA